jgi:putative DNA primase/helicase
MIAETLARTLGGHKAGAGWVARCPAHQDHNPSLSIKEDKDGKVLVYCHAGCKQDAVIAALRARGLWHRTPCEKPERSHPRVLADKGDAVRTTGALAIWESTMPGAGTLMEPYFRSRRIYAPIAATLRFHPALLPAA